MFGTERMALATLEALRGQVQGCIVAPPGPVHAAARAAGLHSTVAPGRAAVLWALWRQLRHHPHGALLTTGVWQSAAAWVLQRLSGGRGAHLHMVHGGTDERLSYGRKRWLARLPLRFVAVSDFVRERLLAHGVPADRIEVVGNFLPARHVLQRAPFQHDGVRRVVVLSRLDRIKRVGLLFDALERVPGLERMQFDVYGSGEEADRLQERARRHPNVRLHGFVPDAAAALQHADLLLHTCPEEPFGLVLLEAFAAGVPVLVPNSGGAGGLVQHGVNGWHFSANDPVALGQRLQVLGTAPAALLDSLVQGGRQALARQHDPQRQARRYARLLGLQ
jgi:glycosyltransferase involved in cell wall biosynthesis